MLHKRTQIEICVDTREFGNDSRFLRRSCQPNAELRHSIKKKKIQLFIVTLKSIKPFTEITIRHEPHDLPPTDGRQPFPDFIQPTSTECACDLGNSCIYRSNTESVENNPKILDQLSIDQQSKDNKIKMDSNKVNDVKEEKISDECPQKNVVASGLVKILQNTETCNFTKHVKGKFNNKSAGKVVRAGARKYAGRKRGRKPKTNFNNTAAIVKPPEEVKLSREERKLAVIENRFAQMLESEARKKRIKRNQPCAKTPNTIHSKNSPSKNKASFLSETPLLNDNVPNEDTNTDVLITNDIPPTNDGSTIIDRPKTYSANEIESPEINFFRDEKNSPKTEFASNANESPSAKLFLAANESPNTKLFSKPNEYRTTEFFLEGNESSTTKCLPESNECPKTTFFLEGNECPRTKCFREPNKSPRKGTVARKRKRRFRNRKTANNYMLPKAIPIAQRQSTIDESVAMPSVLKKYHQHLHQHLRESNQGYGQQQQNHQQNIDEYQKLNDLNQCGSHGLTPEHDEQNNEQHIEYFDQIEDSNDLNQYENQVQTQNPDKFQENHEQNIDQLEESNDLNQYESHGQTQHPDHEDQNIEQQIEHIDQMEDSNDLNQYENQVQTQNPDKLQENHEQNIHQLEKSNDLNQYESHGQTQHPDHKVQIIEQQIEHIDQMEDSNNLNQYESHVQTQHLDHEYQKPKQHIEYFNQMEDSNDLNQYENQVQTQNPDKLQENHEQNIYQLDESIDLNQYGSHGQTQHPDHEDQNIEHDIEYFDKIEDSNDLNQYENQVQTQNPDKLQENHEQNIDQLEESNDLNQYGSHGQTQHPDLEVQNIDQQIERIDQMEDSNDLNQYENQVQTQNNDKLQENHEQNIHQLEKSNDLNQYGSHGQTQHPDHEDQIIDQQIEHINHLFQKLYQHFEYVNQMEDSNDLNQYENQVQTQNPDKRQENHEDNIYQLEESIDLNQYESHGQTQHPDHEGQNIDQQIEQIDLIEKSNDLNQYENYVQIQNPEHVRQNHIHNIDKIEVPNDLNQYERHGQTQHPDLLERNNVHNIDQVEEPNDFNQYKRPGQTLHSCQQQRNGKQNIDQYEKPYNLNQIQRPDNQQVNNGQNIDEYQKPNDLKQHQDQGQTQLPGALKRIQELNFDQFLSYQVKNPHERCEKTQHPDKPNGLNMHEYENLNDLKQNQSHGQTQHLGELKGNPELNFEELLKHPDLNQHERRGQIQHPDQHLQKNGQNIREYEKLNDLNQFEQKQHQNQNKCLQKLQDQYVYTYYPSSAIHNNDINSGINEHTTVAIPTAGQNQNDHNLQNHNNPPPNSNSVNSIIQPLGSECHQDIRSCHNTESLIWRQPGFPQTQTDSKARSSKSSIVSNSESNNAPLDLSMPSKNYVFFCADARYHNMCRKTISALDKQRCRQAIYQESSKCLETSIISSNQKFQPNEIPADMELSLDKLSLHSGIPSKDKESLNLLLNEHIPKYPNGGLLNPVAFIYISENDEKTATPRGTKIPKRIHQNRIENSNQSDESRNEPEFFLKPIQRRNSNSVVNGDETMAKNGKPIRSRRSPPKIRQQKIKKPCNSTNALNKIVSKQPQQVPQPQNPEIPSIPLNRWLGLPPSFYLRMYNQIIVEQLRVTSIAIQSIFSHYAPNKCLTPKDFDEIIKACDIFKRSTPQKMRSPRARATSGQQYKARINKRNGTKAAGSAVSPMELAIDNYCHQLEIFRDSVNMRYFTELFQLFSLHNQNNPIYPTNQLAFQYPPPPYFPYSDSRAIPLLIQQQIPYNTPPNKGNPTNTNHTSYNNNF